MRAMRRLQHAEELLDSPQHDAHELEQSLGHVAGVNRWLGGTAAVRAHLAPLLTSGSVTRVLDIATGSADIPRALVRWARKRHAPIEVVATDVHPQMLAIARAQSRGYPEIRVESADALKLPYPDDSFDAALLSLALHHFEADAQLQVLREMARVSTRLVLVNDLERTRLNYLGARFLGSTYWRGNRLTRHDGPLSVLRSFTRSELQDIARAAGLQGSVHRHFFQRIVLAATPSAKAAAVRTELR